MKISQGLTKKTKIIICVIGFSIGLGIMSYIVFKPSSAKIVDNIIEESKEESTEFIEEVKAHETQIIRETTVIRERVAAETQNLEPDALLNGVLFELELFRRGGASADYTTESSSRMGN